MRKFLVLTFTFLFLNSASHAAPLQANISKEGEAGINKSLMRKQISLLLVQE